MSAPRSPGRTRGRMALRGTFAALLGLCLATVAPMPAEAGPRRDDAATAKRAPAPAARAARPEARRATARPQRARPPARPAAQRAAPPAPRPAPPDIPRALGHAARHAGVEPSVMAALAWRESRFDPRARNPNSSARGLMQFTEETWLEAVRDHGRAHGLAREAARLSTDPQTGAISTRTPRERQQLLARRNDARLAALLAAERAAAARPVLEAALGRAVTPADLYAAHMLGLAGARRFLAELDARPDRAATEVAGAEAVARNRSVFVARDGRLRTLREVHAAMAASVTEGEVALAGLAAAPRNLVLAARTPTGRGG